MWLSSVSSKKSDNSLKLVAGNKEHDDRSISHLPHRDRPSTDPPMKRGFSPAAVQGPPAAGSPLQEYPAGVSNQAQSRASQGKPAPSI